MFEHDGSRQHVAPRSVGADPVGADPVGDDSVGDDPVDSATTVARPPIAPHERLDDEQRAVAVSDERCLRVLAGAGTGKTTALTARVAHLVEHGVPAERILLLTFTRRAARQMVNRANARLRNQSRTRRSGRIVGGTFHSVAHRVLREHADSVGLAAGFSVLDSSDAADLMDVVRDEVVNARAVQETSHKRRFPRKSALLDIYSRAVDTNTAISGVVPQIAPWATLDIDLIAEVCRGYVARKRSRGLLDFDDLLLYWRAAMRHPQIGSQVAGLFEHVLVDEYQDVNGLQVEVLQALVGNDRALTVVGDDAQAIYSFRASSPRHILDFDQDFPGAATLPLTSNYRSKQTILAVANSVADCAPGGFSTRLRVGSESQSGGLAPRLVQCADEEAQSEAVCERILGLREAGTALKEQAVLVRAAHHSSRLELELSRRAIPFVKYGGLRYLESAHVKDLLAAFRLADNHRDELAWFRLLQLLPGVGPATSRRVLTELGLHLTAKAAAVEDDDVLLRWPLARQRLSPAAQLVADGLVQAIGRRENEAVTGHAQRIHAAVSPLVEANYDDADARLTDLIALLDMTRSVTCLSEIAAENALEPSTSTGDLAGPPVIDEDWLVISTVHSAKGLEWDAVHLIHAADGNFPSDMALGSAEGLEEERRLFYVAATRARDYLDVYVPLRYHHRPSAHDDRHSWAQPSRFLAAPTRDTFETVEYLRPTDLGAIDLPVVDTGSLVDSALVSLWQ